MTVTRFPGFRRIAAALLAAGLIAAGVLPPASAPAAVEGTGLPLPRFVSLRASEVNLRTGPGVQYPIEWVYRKRGLPVEVIAEFKTWRKIRDWQGAKGWVHQSMVHAQRGLIVTGDTRTLRSDTKAGSRPLARVEPEVVGRLLSCAGAGAWCRVEFEGIKGWLRRAEFWGLSDGEAVK